MKKMLHDFIVRLDHAVRISQSQIIVNFDGRPPSNKVTGVYGLVAA
jgi:hypothetical protein